VRRAPDTCTYPQIDKNVEREIVNHRTLLHPNIIKFREVMLCSFAWLSVSRLCSGLPYSKQTANPFAVLQAVASHPVSS